MLTEDEYRAIQIDLAERPDQGRIIQGGGGLRKTRIAAKSKGKSGGARIIYFWVPAGTRIYLLLAYPKNEKDDLSAEEKTLLRNLMKRELGYG